MTTKLVSQRLCCADNDVTTPEDFSAKIGYVVKAETANFGSLCLAAATFEDRPLGVIEYAPETTTADVTADDFKYASIISDGYAVAVAGGTITPGTADLVKCHTDGTVVAVTGSETDGFWSVGWVDSMEEGDAVSAGDEVRICVRPQWIFIAAS